MVTEPPMSTRGLFSESHHQGHEQQGFAFNSCLRRARIQGMFSAMLRWRRSSGRINIIR